MIPKDHRVVIGGYPVTTEDAKGRRYCWCGMCNGAMIHDPAWDGSRFVGLTASEQYTAKYEKPDPDNVFITRGEVKRLIAEAMEKKG
jgi:hypothetical protein